MKTVKISQETLESIAEIINYLYLDEEKNWEECNEPEEHIFKDIRMVLGWYTAIENTSLSIVCPECKNLMDDLKDVYVCSNESCGFNLEIK